MLGINLGVRLDALRGTAAPTDPSYSSVSSLLHFDGNLTDQKGKTWTAVGNAAATGAAKYGANSLALDETGDYLHCTNVDFAFGTGDLTVECWVRFAVSPVGNGQGAFHITSAVLPSVVAGLGMGADNATGKWTIYYNGTFATHATLVPSIDTWYHIAMVKTGGFTDAYVDGTSIFHLADTTNYSGQAAVIGGWYSTGFLLNGLIDDFRITKGVARYTANFTSPTAAFPDA